MPTTNADQINSDLLAFVKGQLIGVGAQATGQPITASLSIVI